MSLLVGGALGMLAKTALSSVLSPFLDEAKDVVLSAAEDTVRSTVAGRMSIDEWAQAAIKGVDKVKERVAEEGNLRYVGGKLKFALTAEDAESVTISFQLYFLDEMKKWQLASAASQVPSTKFTNDDLYELWTNHEVVFEVE